MSLDGTADLAVLIATLAKCQPWYTRKDLHMRISRFPHGVHGWDHVLTLMGNVASRNEEGTALAPSSILKRIVGLARQSLPSRMALCLTGVPVHG